jgi:hypothetical protein
VNGRGVGGGLDASAGADAQVDADHERARRQQTVQRVLHFLPELQSAATEEGRQVERLSVSIARRAWAPTFMSVPRSLTKGGRACGAAEVRRAYLNFWNLAEAGNAGRAGHDDQPVLRRVGVTALLLFNVDLVEVDAVKASFLDCRQLGELHCERVSGEERAGSSAVAMKSRTSGGRLGGGKVPHEKVRRYCAPCSIVFGHSLGFDAAAVAPGAGVGVGAMKLPLSGHSPIVFPMSILSVDVVFCATAKETAAAASRSPVDRRGDMAAPSDGGGEGGTSGSAELLLRAGDDAARGRRRQSTRDTEGPETGLSSTCHTHCFLLRQGYMVCISPVTARSIRYRSTRQRRVRPHTPFLCRSAPG